MDGGDGLYRVLVDRCQSLEASHEKLKEQFNMVLQETNNENSSKNGDDTSDSGDMTSYTDWLCLSGNFLSGSPFRKVLEHVGHAVLVSRADSEEIIYWNRSAERLYGYKDHEVLGQKVTELLISEEHRASAKRITEKLISGQSWSGQFPFRKRSGEVLMAIVTESPFYEDNELVGVITVSSDAAVLNNSDNVRTYQDPADGQSRVKGINLKKIQWQSPPLIASSVSNLVDQASKVLLRKRGDSTSSASTNANTEEIQLDTQYVKSERPPRAPAARFVFPVGKNKTDAESSEKDESTFESSQPSKIAAKVLSKLYIGGVGSFSKDKVQNGCNNMSVSKEVKGERHSPRASEANKYCNCSSDANHDVLDTTDATPFTTKRAYQHVHSQMISSGDLEHRECNECAGGMRSAEQLSRSNLLPNGNELKADVQSLKPLEMEDELQHKQLDHQRLPNAVESTGSSHGSSSSKGDHESNLIVDCEIRWEDLNLREEIGQGSYAVVHRGIWNGSDVAVKVYFGSLCSEETLLDYKKEIDIMRRLRHPNVLLFMGAVHSQEKLAVVTEYLPRGSLFKTLHKSNQLLDIRRRLRMALDVARGMNYLHHRNPPIVHRDLKSSNLLVDKSWTVKVGDFGLSKLMNTTFLTAKSGRGTPQWMAPEVLRNEPSTEKSDIFSFGVILWELMTESIPWKNLNSLQVVGVVGFMDRRLDVPENIDPRVSSIIHDCWHSNPVHRPSFEEIIQIMTDLIQSIIGMTAKKRKGS